MDFARRVSDLYSKQPAMLGPLKSRHLRQHAGLPWVALKFAKPTPWLVKNARKFNHQNKLGFVVTLAKRVAESRNQSRLSELSQLEQSLDEKPPRKRGFSSAPYGN